MYVFCVNIKHSSQKSAHSFSVTNLQRNEESIAQK